MKVLKIEMPVANDMTLQPWFKLNKVRFIGQTQNWHVLVVRQSLIGRRHYCLYYYYYFSSKSMSL